ncbi:hypothetical protein GOP47_0030506, partial [Adiantum capillus-veneris]
TLPTPSPYSLRSDLERERERERDGTNAQQICGGDDGVEVAGELASSSVRDRGEQAVPAGELRLPGWRWQRRACNLHLDEAGEHGGVQGRCEVHEGRDAVAWNLSRDEEEDNGGGGESGESGEHEGGGQGAAVLGERRGSHCAAAARGRCTRCQRQRSARVRTHCQTQDHHDEELIGRGGGRPLQCPAPGLRFCCHP